MQAAKFFVQCLQAGGNARQAAITLIGGGRCFDGFGERLFEPDKSARGRAFLGKIIELLLGVLDQFARLGIRLLGRIIGQLVANSDQLATQGEFIDNARIGLRRSTVADAFPLSCMQLSGL